MAIARTCLFPGSGRRLLIVRASLQAFAFRRLRNPGLHQLSTASISWTLATTRDSDRYRQSPADQSGVVSAASLCHNGLESGLRCLTNAFSDSLRECISGSIGGFQCAQDR